jgi:tetratricopeptide (TPR) repeat protein
MRRVPVARAIAWAAVALLAAGYSAVAMIAIGNAITQELKDPQPLSARTKALRAQGQHLGYSLDHEGALATFQEVIAADPDHPAAYRLAAATAWIRLLFQQGAVTAEDYLGQARADRQKQPPSRELDAFFRDHLARAVSLAEQRCRANSKDADAHFQMGAAYGFIATYAATVEGRMFESLRAARRAYSEHQRVLDLDPSRKDAGMIVGMYRYGVSTLSLPTRLVAHLAGFAGGRERGIRMVEEAAQDPSDIQTNARFALIVIYNRETRYDDALRVIRDLQQQFPRNRLLWLEAGSTALRAGRPLDARRALEEGWAKLQADPRPRAFGELARWHYYIGASLVALKQGQAATRELQAALQDPARPWIHGRVRAELGKVADLAGDRTRAANEYEEAIRLCAGDGDDAGAREARMLLRRGYQ